MRLNEHTVIEGSRVLLVPYEKHHVLKYHNWMKSRELQILTASEPLSLEEEFEMQKSWREDSDIKYNYVYFSSFMKILFTVKIMLYLFIECTFIVLCKKKFEETKNETEAMIGDTNIFLKNDNEIAEVEIMIAENSARGKGLGKEAVLLMMRYGIQHLTIKKFRAIILDDNTRSISLFENLGFKQVHENRIFSEVVLEAEVTDAWRDYIKSKIEIYCEKIINQL